MIVVPSDRTGAHDGPEWARISARYVGEPKNGNHKGKAVILTDPEGHETRLPHKVDAVTMLDSCWPSLNKAIETGEPINGYRIRMA